MVLACIKNLKFQLPLNRELYKPRMETHQDNDSEQEIASYVKEKKENFRVQLRRQKLQAEFKKKRCKPSVKGKKVMEFETWLEP